MIKFLKNLNTNLNLFNSLGKKLKKVWAYIKEHKFKTIFLPLIILIIALIAYNKFVPKPPEKLYEFTTVKRQNLEETIVASGKIYSQSQVELKFQAGGQLNWVGVKQGDQVQAWQAIASVDQRALKKSLQQELIDYSKERNDFEEDRLETYKGMEITDTIRRILEKNQWDLERAVLDVEIDDIALQYSTLVTPIAGIVTNIDVPIAGVNITPLTATFTVADPDHLEFRAEVDEADIGLINATQSAEITLDAYLDQVFPVTVDWVDFNSTLDSSGSTIYIVKFYLDNTDQRFRLGMNGEVTITTNSKTDILTVPIQSLIEDETSTKVQVLENNKIIDQVVTTGISGEDDVEITSGLKENQTIVLSKKSKKK